MSLSLNCIDSNVQWLTPDDRKVDHPFQMILSQVPLTLLTETSEVRLVARQRLTPYFDTDNDEYRCSTNAYHYTLSDEHHAEMVSWHWHPDTSPAPHVHVPALDSSFHIPSGRVAFERVVRFLIEDIGVVPARDDWDEVLAEQEARHRKWRKWS